MSIDKVVNLMLQESVDIEVINAIKSLAHSIGFTETIFVSIAGDNSNGSSWTKAYTSLPTALDWVENNQSSGESHLILIGDGEFDINTTGDREYENISVALIGIGRNKTFIVNDHATATSILKFNGCRLTISGLTIYTKDNNITGLHIDDTVGGWAGNGTVMENVDFKTLTPTAAHTLLYLEGSIEKLQMKNCDFYGNTTYTTALYTDDAAHNYYTNIHFYSCFKGIHLSDGDDRDNYFKDIYFSWCVTCIQIDNAAAWGNNFENIHFNYTYTTNISDIAGNYNYYHNLVKNGTIYEEQEEFYPNDLTGIAVTAGVGANAYSAANVEIKSAAAATEPYYVKGFAYEADTAERWGIKFAVGSGTGIQTTSIVEGVVNQLKVYYFDKPFIIRQAEALDCGVKSETGGNVMKIWLIIEKI